MTQVFVSYSRHSEEIVKGLVADLGELGHQVWFDKDLVGGQAWWDQILGRIRDSDVLVFVLDAKALSSHACRSEWTYASDLGKTVLPVLVADGVSSNLLPPVLSQTQFVDYRKQDRLAALRLARALADSPAARPLPDPLPPEPDLPISYLGRLGQQIDAPATLTFEVQSALLVDLRRGVRDVETMDDALALLERLRKRRDLLVPRRTDRARWRSPSAPLRRVAPRRVPGDPGTLCTRGVTYKPSAGSDCRHAGGGCSD
jgi:hypothetical protein